MIEQIKLNDLRDIIDVAGLDELKNLKEINKYSLCDNTYAREKYNWVPKISMREGLRRLIEAECELLNSLRVDENGK